MSRVRSICLLLIFTWVTITTYAQPDNNHQLKVSANHSFFVGENGKPFFWLGDTGWLLFTKLTREEAEIYLEDRRLKGFNVIQVMLLHTVAAVNVYGDSALINKNVAHPRTTPDSTTEYINQYDYWDHVEYIIDLAAKKNLYMALVPVWGSNVKAGLVKKEDAEEYARWLADRFHNKWNIIWLNGGDTKGGDAINTWNAIGNTLKSNDPGHLITFHPFGRTSSSQWFHNETWLDFNMFQSGHKNYEQNAAAGDAAFGPDNYKYVNHDAHLEPLKPVLDGEPSYELIPQGLHDTTQPYWLAKDVRRYAYWSVFAGAAGHTYGHSSVMQMHLPKDVKSAYGSKKYWYQALNDDGARQMLYLKKLILSKPYFERIPDQSLIAGEVGVKYNYIAATRGNDFAFIYNYTGRTFEVNMGKIKGQKLRASWYNPRNGRTTSLGIVENKGTHLFDPPGEKAEGNDWVLILEKM